MSEDEKSPGLTIRFPVPRVLLPEAPARSLDPRTAEVLRALDRAKETVVKADLPISLPSAADLPCELRALRDALAKTTPVTEETAKSLVSSARALERVVVPSEKLADLQRGQEGSVRELREAVHALKRQGDALAAWRAWWARQVAAFCLVIALLLAGGIGLAWRAHTLARTTHDILAQILENQERAQAAKAGKRR